MSADLDFEMEHFECADAGAADTFPKAAGDLKRGDLVCIRGRPCKILETETVKTGKHGHAKAVMSVEDIFTGRKNEMAAPATFPMPCPFLHKSEYLLVDIQKDGRLSLLDEDNEERNDLDLPKDDESLAAAIRAHFNNGKGLTLTAHKAMNVEAIISFKLDNGK